MRKATFHLQYQLGQRVWEGIQERKIFFVFLFFQSFGIFENKWILETLSIVWRKTILCGLKCCFLCLCVHLWQSSFYLDVPLFLNLHARISCLNTWSSIWRDLLSYFLFFNWKTELSYRQIKQYKQWIRPHNKRSKKEKEK